MVIGKDYYIEARKGLERINRLEQEEEDKLIRYQKLAESGDVEAQNYLRDLQEKQKAKEEQERKAKELEEQKAREEQRAREEAAEKKRAEAMKIFSSAEINEANGNLETALSLFRQALELGHPEAQNRITALQEKINARDNEADDEAYTRAVQYLDEKNYSQAIDIFRKLADNGYAPAQDKLAWMYQNGWGVEQSYSQAVSWFRKAAEQGNTEAMASMGLMYYRGWGVERDYDTSLEWYGKAARQGSEVAQRRINSIQTLKANKQKIASIERNDDFPIPGTITAETLSVRQSPNTNSTRIKTLRTGHPVSVSKATESDNDYWLYIRTASGTEGWVLGGYVKLIDRNLSYEETNNRRRSLPKSGYVVTRNDTLNLRNIPAVKGSQVIEKLDSGTSFTAYEVFAGDTVDWYRIRTNYGDEGWVSGKYINIPDNNYSSNSSQPQQGGNNRQQSSNSSGGKKLPAFSAKELYNEVVQNPIRAVNKYQGEQIIITGKIIAIGNFLGVPNVTIDVPEEFAVIETFIQKDDPLLQSITKDNIVAIVGYLSDASNSIITIDKCRIWGVYVNGEWVYSELVQR